MNNYLLEVCCADIKSVSAAVNGGAQRIELCSALSLDGLTPSAGLIAAALAHRDIKVHVLIRPREGNFVYSKEEIGIIMHDIQTACEMGVDGIVFGALTPEGDIDIPLCKLAVMMADGLPVTFHRAFDQCRNPEQALEQIIEMGYARLLTSGQQPTAVEGIPMLRKLVDQANGRIIIMPAAGVNADNALTILEATGAHEIHGSLRSLQEGRLITDPAIVQSIVSRF